MLGLLLTIIGWLIRWFGPAICGLMSCRLGLYALDLVLCAFFCWGNYVGCACAQVFGLLILVFFGLVVVSTWVVLGIMVLDLAVL